MNNVAMNLHVKGFAWTCVFISLGTCLKMELLGCMVTLSTFAYVKLLGSHRCRNQDLKAEKGRATRAGGAMSSPWKKPQVFASYVAPVK